MAISQTSAPSQAVPSALIISWPAITPPEGWLLCNGGAVSRTVFANLYNVISTTYGSGDGSTTFNLPTLSGRVAIGKSASNSLGQTSKGVTGDTSAANTGNQAVDHSHSGNTGGASAGHTQGPN